MLSTRPHLKAYSRSNLLQTANHNHNAHAYRAVGEQGPTTGHTPSTKDPPSLANTTVLH